MKPSFIMLHFPQQYNISESVYIIDVCKFGTVYRNIGFHRILKIFYDIFFGRLHMHMNKNNQIKSVLYVYILGKGLYEREENSLKNHFALSILHRFKINKLEL